MQPIDEPVMVPGSMQPKKIGDLKVGDKVLTANGEPTEVTSVSEPADREVYRILCEDGSWVRACEEQQWKVMKVRDAKTGTSMDVGSLRGVYERSPHYLMKFAGLRPTKIDKIEEVGVKRCVTITVASPTGLYVTRRTIVAVGGI